MADTWLITSRCFRRLADSHVARWSVRERWNANPPAGVIPSTANRRQHLNPSGVAVRSRMNRTFAASGTVMAVGVFHVKQRTTSVSTVPTFVQPPVVDAVSPRDRLRLPHGVSVKQDVSHEPDASALDRGLENSSHCGTSLREVGEKAATPIRALESGSTCDFMPVRDLSQRSRVHYACDQALGASPGQMCGPDWLPPRMPTHRATVRATNDSRKPADKRGCAFHVKRQKVVAETSPGRDGEHFPYPAQRPVGSAPSVKLTDQGHRAQWVNRVVAARFAQ